MSTSIPVPKLPKATLEQKEKIKTKEYEMFGPMRKSERNTLNRFFAQHYSENWSHERAKVVWDQTRLATAKISNARKLREQGQSVEQILQPLGNYLSLTPYFRKATVETPEYIAFAGTCQKVTYVDYEVLI